MATKLEVAKFLFGAAGQSSPGERAGTLAGGGNTTVRYGTVKTVDGTSVTILMEDTGETLYTMTTTPVAVGDRVAIIKNGQSVVVYATDQIVEMINKTVVDGDAEYAVGDDAYTAPKSGWSTTMPDVEQGEYLWMRYKTTLKDGTVKTSTPVCLTSAGGLVITSSEVSYAIGTSGTTPPSSGWQSTPPTAKPGQYLWSREVTSYSDGTSMTSYGVSYQGTNGQNGQDGQDGAAGADGADGADGKDGVGIEDSDVTWQKSSSGTTPPTGNWLQSPPDLNPGDYLWTRTVWTYTDGSSTTAYSVSKAGDTGPQGIQGPKGDKGEPRYTWIKYADDANGSGMSDDPDGKDYMGIAYNKESPTESPTASEYSWSLIRGAAGAQGIPGPKGDNGDPTYTWIKYADDDKGTGMTDNPDGKDYIGIAYNKDTPTESPTASDYAWSLTKGETGVGIDKVRDMYYLSTSNTEVTGGTWVYDECPEWQEGRYIWTRMEIAYDDGSVKQTDPILMSALNQANEGVAKINWHFWYDDEGAHVTENENTAQTGANALLAGNKLAFRSGLTELMTIAAALIELGKNSKGARISFCGETGYIDSGESYNASGAISNNGMSIHSDGGILLANGPSDRLTSSDQWVAFQEDGTLYLYPSGIVIDIPNTSDGRRVGELDDWITGQGKDGMWNWRVYASGYREMVGNIQLTFPANSGNDTAVTFPRFCSFEKYTDYSVFCQIIGTDDSGSNYFNHLSVMPIKMGPTGFSLHTWNNSNTTVYYRVSVHVAGWDK